MTANDSEETGSATDPVAEFAAWMRDLHREAAKPSYTAIVRRSRTRYPDATVRESTISDILNGKRLPRWETVEPIAWALGGEPTVAACLEHWKRADAARSTAPAPPTERNDQPPPLPPQTADGSHDHARHTPAGPRRTWPWALATAAVALPLLGWAGAAILTDTTDTRPPTTSGTPGPDPSGSTPTAQPTSAAPTKAAQTPSTAPPAQRQLTAKIPWATSAPTEWTPEKDLGISVTALDGEGVSYFVITPARSCTVTGVAIGESVVITGEDDGWIRLIVTATGHFGPELQDLPVTFQITRGDGDPPRGTKACT
ncbi:transcriptional regulator [Streptomyces barkulensis]|uniref:transcriptional regulator n=1 Tax=Streptomyces barkulensis TaxID=1257026 RepID=UPI000C6EC643|nr:transcriptional regulator [Streptomyces barkulensis]